MRAALSNCSIRCRLICSRLPRTMQGKRPFLRSTRWRLQHPSSTNSTRELGTTTQGRMFRIFRQTVNSTSNRCKTLPCLRQMSHNSTKPQQTLPLQTRTRSTYPFKCSKNSTISRALSHRSWAGQALLVSTLSSHFNNKCKFLFTASSSRCSCTLLGPISTVPTHSSASHQRE